MNAGLNLSSSNLYIKIFPILHLVLQAEQITKFKKKKLEEMMGMRDEVAGEVGGMTGRRESPAAGDIEVTCSRRKGCRLLPEKTKSSLSLPCWKYPIFAIKRLKVYGIVL
ncbi:hypothetical protein Dsin_008403 [Dipteronia sinensis]|uniref:Uncharacterized protein n=1 Tax=Dipteronia sinensis TaxID=43782 RepID=A0AAE0EAM6_9ROSI|nr:hypothetical protein Dsin_008403 [Dipteronia sinensis]